MDACQKRIRSQTYGDYQRKSLVTASRRLQRMLLRIQKFDYEIVYKKGVEMYVADTLRRAYLPASEEKLPINIRRENIEDKGSMKRR